MEYPELTYEECEFIRALGRSSRRSAREWFRYPQGDKMINNLIKKDALFVEEVDDFDCGGIQIFFQCKLNLDHPIIPDLLAMDSL